MCIRDSQGAYVWAYDNLQRKLVVTDNGNGIYNVVVTDTGSFRASYQPNNTDVNTSFPLNPLVSGSIKGTITYTVSSSAGGPVNSLPAQLPGDTGTSAMVLMLFPVGAATVGDSPYTYVYRAGGQTYTQQSPLTPYSIGNITN